LLAYIVANNHSGSFCGVVTEIGIKRTVMDRYVT